MKKIKTKRMKDWKRERERVKKHKKININKKEKDIKE